MLRQEEELREVVAVAAAAAVDVAAAVVVDVDVVDDAGILLVHLEKKVWIGAGQR
jgi:hypothetical protein